MKKVVLVSLALGALVVRGDTPGIRPRPSASDYPSHQNGEGVTLAAVMLSAEQARKLFVAAGYVVYGSSTIFVYTAGRGVFGFTLEPEIGAFVLTFDNMKMPQRGNTYSVNEAYADTFPDSYRAYLAREGKQLP